MDEDPYGVLGLAPGAPPEAVKAAYRALALRFHPDHNPGDRAAEEAFKRVDRAYTFLSDPARKAEYDRASIEPAAETAAEPPAPAWEASAEAPAEVPASDSWRPVRRALDLLLILAGIAIIALWRASARDPGGEFFAAVFGPRLWSNRNDWHVLTAAFGLAGYGAFRLFVEDSA